MTTVTEAVEQAQQNLKRAIKANSDRRIKAAHLKLIGARAKAKRDAQREDDIEKAAREVERDRLTEQERKKQSAADAIEKDIRANETPTCTFVYGGKRIVIALGHREMVSRGTARTAVQRLAYRVVESFEARVRYAKGSLTTPPYDAKWYAPLLSSEQELLPAHRLGLIRIEDDKS